MAHIFRSHVKIQFQVQSEALVLARGIPGYILSAGTEFPVNFFPRVPLTTRKAYNSVGDHKITTNIGKWCTAITKALI